ncbi:hypothetical protein DBR47_04095 [Paucibacter sp. KBW04]|nr:hypothetical protein DBR47_04095 [Paucibacter sp. KBW04]
MGWLGSVGTGSKRGGSPGAACVLFKAKAVAAPPALSRSFRLAVFMADLLLGSLFEQEFILPS